MVTETPTEAGPVVESDRRTKIRLEKTALNNFKGYVWFET